jgi:hypothetical protein
MSNSVPGAGWFQAASSANGKFNASIWNGGIYASTNFGITWTPTTAPTEYWVGLASSADGTKLVAASYSIFAKPGVIYVSTNSGLTWNQTSAPDGNWERVACSADGSRLVVSANNGPIYTSADSGGTWVEAPDLPRLEWYAVCSSADGSKLAVAPFGGTIYTLPSRLVLTATAVSNSVVLSWTTNASGFQLEQTSDLGSATWSAVTNRPMPTNLNYQVILTRSVGSSFFRLKK